MEKKDDDRSNNLQEHTTDSMKHACTPNKTVPKSSEKAGVISQEKIEESNFGSDVDGASMADSSPSASPPRKKLLSDLKQKMLNEERAQKAKLAHEIAFDHNFKLPDGPQEPSPEDKSSEANMRRMRKNISEVMHRAFWDCLKSGIESDPPIYDHAFVLLQEIKGILLSLLPKERKTVFHQRIEDYLDLDFLRQQAENGSLNVKNVAAFIVDTMASMCAPVRDGQVAELRSIDDVVDLFRGIYKVLDLMEIDFVNFSIQVIRPHIQRGRFEYERSQFAKILENSPDGLKHTRNWISNTYQRLRSELEQLYQQMKRDNSRLQGTSASDSIAKKYSEVENAKLSPTSILNAAYGTILSCDFDMNELPETLVMDRERIESLKTDVDRIVLVSSVMITSCGVLGQPIASHREFLEKSKDNLVTLSKPDADQDLTGMLEGMSLQCWKDAVDYAKDGGPELDRCVRPSNESALREQIATLKNKRTHPVFKLLHDRTVDYLLSSAGRVQTRSTSTLPAVPVGLTFMSGALIDAASRYAKLVNMNRAAYGPFYAPVIRDVLGISAPGDEKREIASPKPVARKRLEMSDNRGCDDATPEDLKGKCRVTGSLDDLD